jgi:hypothetical protein
MLNNLVIANFSSIITGTGYSYEKRRRNCDDLPFAGITLFRFNGFYLSFLKHPEDSVKIGCFF